jgi:hypothetical protein
MLLKLVCYIFASRSRRSGAGVVAMEKGCMETQGGED